MSNPQFAGSQPPATSMPPTGHHARLYAVMLAAVTAVVAALVAAFLLGHQDPPPGQELTLVDLQYDAPACVEPDWLKAGTEDTGPWQEHPSDAAHQGVCLSHPFQLDRATLLLRYAGDPTDPGVSASLISDSGEALPLALPRAARHGWLIASVPVPMEWRHKAVQLQLNDASKKPHGWLVVRTLAQSDGAIVTRPLHLSAGQRNLLTVLATVLALLPLAAPVAWRWRTYPLWAASTCLIYLRFRSFYHWDDYALLERFSAASAPDWVHYNGHFEPLFLAVYAWAVGAVGAWYEPLQVGMVLVHAGIITGLYALACANGIHARASALATALYASSWLHVDVAPWFMEAAFLGTSALALAATWMLSAYAKSGARSQVVAAGLAATLACATFSGGLVVPWLCAAQAVLYHLPRRVRWVFGAIGVAGLAVAVLAVPQIPRGPEALHGAARAGAVLRYWATGVGRGGWASYLGLRAAPWVGVLIAVGGAYRLSNSPAKIRCFAAFGALWLASAYVLQALARGDLGAAQALSFRYSHFAMLGAAMLGAAFIQGVTEARSAAVRRWGGAGRRSCHLRGRADQSPQGLETPGSR